MPHRRLAVAALAVLVAATPALADPIANRLYVDAVRSLAGLDEIADPQTRLEAVVRAEALLDRILDEHPDSAVATRVVELRHPGAAARIADLRALRERLAGEAASDADDTARRAAVAADLAERIDAVPALRRLADCDRAAPVGCLRAAATAKLDDLGLRDPNDPDETAMLHALDLVERVAQGDDLSDVDGAAVPWSRDVAVFTAIDLWSQIRGVDSLTPWRGVDPAALPEELAGELAPLLAFLEEREEEADRELRQIVDGTCGGDAAAPLAALAPVLCADVVRVDALDEVWAELPPFQRLGALELLAQQVRAEGHHAAWAAFLYGLDRPTDLAPEEVAFLTRAMVAATIGWYLRP